MLGYGNASGKQFLLDTNSNLIEVEGASLSFTQVPINLGVSSFFKISPSWPIDFGVTAAYQNMFFEEIRSAQAGDIFDFDDDLNKKGGTRTYRNKGWSHGLLFGASFRLLLNRLGQKEVRSLKRSFGFEDVHISFFYHQVNHLSGKAMFIGPEVSSINFSRSEIGIEFTFESS